MQTAAIACVASPRETIDRFDLGYGNANRTLNVTAPENPLGYNHVRSSFAGRVIGALFFCRRWRRACFFLPCFCPGATLHTHPTMSSQSRPTNNTCRDSSAKVLFTMSSVPVLVPSTLLAWLRVKMSLHELSFCRFHTGLQRWRSHGFRIASKISQDRLDGFFMSVSPACSWLGEAFTHRTTQVKQLSERLSVDSLCSLAGDSVSLSSQYSQLVSFECQTTQNLNDNPVQCAGNTSSSCCGANPLGFQWQVLLRRASGEQQVDTFVARNLLCLTWQCMISTC